MNYGGREISVKAFDFLSPGFVAFLQPNDKGCPAPTAFTLQRLEFVEYAGGAKSTPNLSVKGKSYEENDKPEFKGSEPGVKCKEPAVRLCSTKKQSLNDANKSRSFGREGHSSTRRQEYLDPEEGEEEEEDGEIFAMSSTSKRQLTEDLVHPSRRGRVTSSSNVSYRPSATNKDRGENRCDRKRNANCIDVSYDDGSFSYAATSSRTSRRDSDRYDDSDRRPRREDRKSYDYDRDYNHRSNSAKRDSYSSQSHHRDRSREYDRSSSSKGYDYRGSKESRSSYRDDRDGSSASKPKSSNAPQKSSKREPWMDPGYTEEVLNIAKIKCVQCGRKKLLKEFSRNNQKKMYKNRALEAVLLNPKEVYRCSSCTPDNRPSETLICVQCDERKPKEDFALKQRKDPEPRCKICVDNRDFD